MNPATDPDDDPRKRPKNPFDDIMRGFGFAPDDFERVFQEMQKALQDMMKQGGFEPGKPYVHGFSFKIGPDGKPVVSEFGNKTQKPAKGKIVPFSEERVPLTEVLAADDQVTVTVEIPGVNKEDIDLHVTRDRLEITVNNDQRRYHKTVDLPQPVKPETTKAGYRNGVLDIVVKREKPGPPKGHRVRIE